ncbi:MAG: hypothetical protein LBQ60_09880 [Bacteroidales bacterium]|jgi:hypothetical protein|nr:hypothetical protein [Bacteroidales bacterium]
MEKKITIMGVLQEGLGIGLKNALSLLGAVVLWILTIWIPYINVGTTIAISAIPIELSKGKIISPLFIFDEKYRQFMGEYFSLIGLMLIAIWPAMLFLVVPGIVIAIGWSLSIFLLIDKQLSPTQAMIQSNKATYGYKWTIFGVSFLLMLAVAIVGWIFSKLGSIGSILNFLLLIVMVVVNLGCNSVIYRDLTKDNTAPAVEEAKEEV